MATAKFLLKVLDELSEEDIERFKFYLTDDTEFKSIPRGRLQGKSPVQLATLLQEHYAEQAPDISRKILLKIPRRDLVEMMFGDTRESEGRTQAQQKRERPEDHSVSVSDPLEREMSTSQKKNVEPKTLTDKKLMQLANNMGQNWKQIGIQFLDLQSWEIEQCESQHPHIVMQIFEMLKHWKNREREKATALKLHSILAERECPISSEQFDCLLEENH
ncbi:pyrin-like [Heterodontus francisci]|uniref:pyrin-like n=1 Tax=Heterodontus francisci TaxID=7792 RepID=UPI00355C774A